VKPNGTPVKEIERPRILFEITFCRVIHVSDTGSHRIEGFEWLHERASRKHLDPNSPAGRSFDSPRETNTAGMKSWQSFGPVGHHL
jgi:hypothetical protein